MSTSVSSVTNHFPSAENGFTTTTSGSVSSGATTVGLASVAGYTNGEIVVLVIDPTDATKKQTFTGVMDTGGSQVTDVVWTAGTNQTHALGATVVDYATATHISMMTKGILVHADQDGTLKAGAVDNAGVLASDVVTTAKILDANVTAAKLATPPSRYVQLDTPVVVVDTDPSGTGSNSVDITANTSATAYAANLNVGVSSTVTVGRSVFVRETGSGASNDNTTRAVQNQNTSGTKCWNMVSVPLDSSQSFDWLVDNADVNAVTIVVRGYWETVA